MPRHKNRVNFDPTLKTSQFRPPHRNQVNSDPYTEIELTSTTRTTKSRFILTLKSSQVSSPTLKLSQFRPPIQKQVNFDAHTKTKWFPAHLQDPSHFRLPTKEPSQSIPTSFSIHTLNPSNFWPAHKAEVNFDPHGKNTAILIPSIKPSQFRSRHKN